MEWASRIHSPCTNPNRSVACPGAFNPRQLFTSFPFTPNTKVLRVILRACFPRIKVPGTIGFYENQIEPGTFDFSGEREYEAGLGRGVRAGGQAAMPGAEILAVEHHLLTAFVSRPAG